MSCVLCDATFFELINCCYSCRPLKDSNKITVKLITFAAKNGAQQLSAEPIVVSINSILTRL